MSPVFCALLTLASPSGQAFEVDFLQELAVRAYRQRRYERALALFEEVHRMAPSRRSAFNVARAAEEAGAQVLAFAFFNAFVSSDETSEDFRDKYARAARARLGRRLCLLRVVSSPPGARVFIDRREVGGFGTTPQTIALAEPGARRVEVALAGYRPQTREVRLSLGTTVELDVTLEPHRGQLRIDVQPARGAVIELMKNQSPRRKIPAGRTTTVAVGRYRVTARAPDHTPASVTVEVQTGKTERRRLILRPRPSPIGRLLVSAGGVQADLFIDGVRRAVTPAALDVEVGAHTLELRVGGDAVWTDRIRVAKGASVVRLVPLGEDGP